MTLAQIEYKNIPTNAATVTAVKNAFNNGSLVMNYVGHGSVENWSRIPPAASAVAPRPTSSPCSLFIFLTAALRN